MGRLLKPMLPRFLIMLLAFVAVIISGWVEATLFIGGMLFGAALRQVSLTYQAVRFIPLFLDVFDWQKVDQLLDEHSEVTSRS